MSTQKQDPTRIRLLFSEYLKEMANLIDQSEKTAVEDGASGKLALAAFANNLKSEASKLEDGKFRFLIIGDFNRGKSTILNALFKKELLPMGVTATTAIPTFIKYGNQKEVIVHKKSGATERLSLEEYRKNYTLNSKQVKDKVKRLFKDVGEWLAPLDYAEFYFPLDALYGGVEFIDTAGLNHTHEENEKTFSYIQDCHAILFVLSADQQFSLKEKDYLKEFLNRKEEFENAEKKSEIDLRDILPSDCEDKKDSLTRPIFYLINKWETIDEADKDEVHEGFVEVFENCLKLSSEEIEQMWGKSIFDVYAKTALAKILRGEYFDKTGLDTFEKRLNAFLIHERLQTEITQAVDSARFASIQVIEKTDDRLAVLSDSVKSLEEKIAKATPHVEVMKKIIQLLEDRVKDRKDSCVNRIGNEYTKYFSDLLMDFERDFEMPSTYGLRDNQREEYTDNLKRQLADYRQRKIDNWHEISKGIVLEEISSLKDYFQNEISLYLTKRKEIREILNQRSFRIEDRIQVAPHENPSSGEVSLSAAQAGSITKMVAGAASGVIGTATAGIGAATAANVYAGTHILLAAGLSLTPVGWALLGVSAVTGGGLAWWQRRNEIRKFQDEMRERVRQEFKKLLDTSNVTSVKERVGELFSSFSYSVDQMSNDINSIEKSFNNLINSKKNSEINIAKETDRLNSIKLDISSQLKKIHTMYKETYPSIRK